MCKKIKNKNKKFPLTINIETHKTATSEKQQLKTNSRSTVGGSECVSWCWRQRDAHHLMLYWSDLTGTTWPSITLTYREKPDSVAAISSPRWKEILDYLPSSYRWGGTVASLSNSLYKSAAASVSFLTWGQMLSFDSIYGFYVFLF